MTKQETIEFLKGSKIYVNGKSKEIQEKLYALGMCSYCGTTVTATDKPFIYIWSSCINFSFGINMEDFSNDDRKEITAEEILNLTWDEDKPKHDFKPFDRVLVRDSNDDCWFATFLSHCRKSGRYTICNGSTWNQCIPYEGNEHLLGTTDKPDNN